MDPESREVVVGSGESFWSDQRLHVHAPSFEAHLRNLRVPIAARELAARLARLGFERRQLAQPRASKGRRQRRWFHVSPEGFDPSEHV